MAGWVKCGALRWLGHVIRRNEDDFVKKMCKGRFEGQAIRETPPVKWIGMDQLIGHNLGRVGWQARD